jgi:hypothetical protein
MAAAFMPGGATSAAYAAGAAPLMPTATKPRHHGGERARHRVDEERRGQAEALRQHAAGQRPDADGEQEDTLVDGHHAAASRRRRDVGEHDLAGDEHEGGADAGDEARGDEHGKARRHGAEHVAGSRDEAAQRERRAAADDVGEPADGHRDEEAREAVHGDGEADGRLRHAERARVEGEDGNDAAESELVDGDQHAHPHEDARRVGTDHGARL